MMTSIRFVKLKMSEKNKDLRLWAGRPIGGRADHVGRFSLGRPVKFCLAGRHNRCVLASAYERGWTWTHGHGLTADFAEW